MSPTVRPEPVYAIIYARTSSQRESKYDNSPSIDVQLDVCKKLAEREGFTVIGEYAEPNTSGAIWADVEEANYDIETNEKYGMERRPQFTKVLNLFKENKATVLIVWNSTRIAREINGFHMEWLRMFFRKHNILIYTEEKGKIDYKDFYMDLITSLESKMLRKEVNANAQNSRKAKKDLVKDGYIIAAPPYGYYSTGKNNVLIDEDESKIVKRIFELYTSGRMGTPKIAQVIHQEGGSTKRTSRNKPNVTGRWHATTIQKILRRPCYMGMYRKEDKTLAKSPIFAKIIDEKVWYDAQTIWESTRKERSQKGKHKYADENYLVGVFKCGKCGGSLCVKWSTWKNNGIVKRTPLYYCPTQTCEDRACIRVDESHLITETVVKYFDVHPEALRLADGAPLIIEEITKLNNELNELETKKKEASEKLFDDLTALKVVLGKMNEKIETLTKQIEDRKKQITSTYPINGNVRAKFLWIVSDAVVYRRDSLRLTFRGLKLLPNMPTALTYIMPYKPLYGSKGTFLHNNAIDTLMETIKRVSTLQK